MSGNESDLSGRPVDDLDETKVNDTYKTVEHKKRNYEKYLDGETWQPQQQYQPYQPNQQYQTNQVDLQYQQNQQQYEQYRPGGGFATYVPASNKNNNNCINNNHNVPRQPQNIQGLEEPVSIGEWVVTYLVLMIPCINFIFMFIWGFSGNVKKSRSNFCKAALIVCGVASVAAGIIYLICIGVYMFCLS